MAIGADGPAVLTQEAGRTRHQKLEKQALRGTIYIIGYYGVSIGLRMVSSVVLSRLFSPEFFGLMTLLTTVLVGLNLFSHIGLGDSVIQSPRGDEPAVSEYGLDAAGNPWRRPLGYYHPARMASRPFLP